MIRLEKDEKLNIDCGTSTDTKYYIQSLTGKTTKTRANKINATSETVLEGPAELLFLSLSQEDTGSHECKISVESEGTTVPVYSHALPQGDTVIISRQSIFSIISGKVNA